MLIQLLFVLLACGDSQTEGPAPAPAPAAQPAPEPEPEVDPKVEMKAAWDALAEDAQHPWLMAEGEKVYMKGGHGGIACNTCHNADGKGIKGAFPPLVGQKEHMGDCAQTAGNVINGLTGEMVVDGVTYNGVMIPQGELLNDYEIAAVATYVRNSWGNDYGDCTPDDVAKAR
jgi:mono/diheme cytochrome c family protein